MSARDLPDRPNIEQYRKQAKDLLKRCRDHDETALERIRRHHPHPPADRCRLADAQLVIAREHGFESWPKFLKGIEMAGGRLSSRQVWRTAERAVVAGDVATLERLLEDYADVFRDERPQSWWHNTLTPSYDAGEAREIIRKTHEFDSWAAYGRFVNEAKRAGSPVARFEAAVDAIVGGKIERLRSLLRADGELIRARSSRTHEATLLHYVGANGVEGFRQHTPPNAMQVLDLLLERGAEIDAVAKMYGGSTTLGLVATSRHPVSAGLQEALIDRLLANGARLDLPGAGNGSPLVNGCLANGQPKAAAYLASRGAPLDPEAAGGVGRIDVLANCFTSEGRIKPPAMKAQLESALVIAAGTRHGEVVEFLVDRGIAVDARAHGTTGLNFAALNGDVDIVRTFIARGASLETRNDYGGTALDATLWGIVNRPDETAGWNRQETDFVAVIAALLEAGATVEPSYLEWWQKQTKPSREIRMKVSKLLTARLGRH
jgi:Ankyrin repeats (3 copies)